MVSKRGHFTVSAIPTSTLCANHFEMPVPKHRVLHPGVRVNIVLKADQRTGKLTPGKIADLLTKGDHPRGIKVRLEDGQIGRVQSLGSGNVPSSLNSHSTKSSLQPSPYSDNSRRSSGTKGSWEDIYRNGREIQPQPRSLADYIKSSPRHWSPQTEKAMDPQTRLEVAFPNLDTALIAAILVDYPDPVQAEEVLDSLTAV
ncbi:MAG: hypothetical protein Q9170_006564 [Blastenia crenularia]